MEVKTHPKALRGGCVLRDRRHYILINTLKMLLDLPYKNVWHNILIFRIIYCTFSNIKIWKDLPKCYRFNISKYQVLYSQSSFFFYWPKMSSNSWALPRANTGIRHLPPLLTISWTSPVNLASLSSLFSWMWVPYVDSWTKRNFRYNAKLTWHFIFKIKLVKSYTV